MLRPLPVVDVSTEGGRRYRRCRHKAHVLIHFVKCDIVSRASPHGSEPCLKSCLLAVLLFHEVTESAQSGRLSLCGKLFLKRVDFVGHVKDPFQEVDALAGDVDLFLCTECPEAFLEVVVLRSAESVHIAVCAVVVGDEESLVRNYASGTSEFH